MVMKSRRWLASFMKWYLLQVLLLSLLTNILSMLLVKMRYPSTNVLGFAADATNSMFGEHNSVVSRLRLANPNIISCNVFATQHIYVLLQLVKNFLELWRSSFELFCSQFKTSVTVCCDTKFRWCRTSQNSSSLSNSLAFHSILCYQIDWAMRCFCGIFSNSFPDWQSFSFW